MEQSYRIHDSKIKKLIVIVITILALLIPIAFLNGTIESRENYKIEATQDIKKAWAGEQTLQAPRLYFEVAAKNGIEEKELPINNYNADVKLNTEIRKKGIFKIPVYTADVKLSGNFTNYYGNLSNKSLKLDIYVTDERGFISSPVVKLNNKTISKSTNYLTVNIDTSSKEIPFEITYSIRGLNEVAIGMDGETNTVQAQGNWANPSFNGNFLPVEHSIKGNSFSAKWSVPRIALGETMNNAQISLLVPNDNYKMTAKILKYAFLLLSLTFLSYFIFEITSKPKQKIHPLQYILLGFAILIFHLLLLSLSEIINFGLSYLISALLTVLMIFFYTNFVITKGQSNIFAISVSAILAALYAFFYILLLFQSISLLVGSLGLFAILCIVMYVTRNIDWYSEKDN